MSRVNSFCPKVSFDLTASPKCHSDQGTKKPGPIGYDGTGHRPGNDLLSQGLSPHYHRRNSVSLPGSEWDRVVPPCYGHQRARLMHGMCVLKKRTPVTPAGLEGPWCQVGLRCRVDVVGLGKEWDEVITPNGMRTTAFADNCRVIFPGVFK